MEIVKGQPGAEVLFVGYHNASGRRLLLEDWGERCALESSRPHTQNRARKRALRSRPHPPRHRKTVARLDQHMHWRVPPSPRPIEIHAPGPTHDNRSGPTRPRRPLTESLT